MSTAAPIHTVFGCDTPQAHAFVQHCEFISLGCYCAVSEALGKLGVRQRAYPFDWVRSPIQGIRHCLETDFEDFLTYTDVKEENGHTVYANTRWGGSFWHHDIVDEKVQQDFGRRIDRLLGFGEVPQDKAKVFVRVVNSTKELDEALSLMEALRCKFPCAPIFLLLIVDMQEDAGPKCLEADEGARVLFHFVPRYTVHKPGLQGQEDFDHRAAAYAHIVASSVRLWTGGVEGMSLRRFANITELAASCTQWDGGNCGVDLFAARFFMGAALARRGNTDCTLPKLVHGREAHIVLTKDDVFMGPLTLDVFGTNRKLDVPSSAKEGDIVQFRLVKGVLTVVLISTSQS